MTGGRHRPALAPEDELTAGGRPELESVLPALAAARAARGRDPVVPPTSARQLEQMLPTKLPREGIELDRALQSLTEVLIPYSRRNGHPGMFGYVCSPGLSTDLPANALVAALNQNVTGFSSAPAATTIERVLLHWLVELIGMPAGADGVLLSGGSLANYTGLCCALFHALGESWLRDGLAAAPKTPTLHLARTAHFSIARAARLLGIGQRNLVYAETDAARRIYPAALERALVRDREAGLTPVGVVASAGSTTLGTVDPLDEIADVCRQQGTWLHVDGAYGAAAMLAPTLRPRLRGIEHADSLSFDLHKWMYVGFDASALLLRDPSVARSVFFTDADYVRIPRDPPPEQHAFFHLGPETSRRLRALPAVLALMHHGADRIGRNIEHNAECAAYLAAHVSDHPDLELVAEPTLSICCFRYAPAGLVVPERDRINAAIRERLEAEGEFFLSATVVDEHPVLRVCIINPATRAEHVERLVEAVLRLGAELAAPAANA